MKTINREEWLGKAAAILAKRFVQHKFKVPANVRYTCGWPSRSATSSKTTRIGECWADTCSKGKTFEVFISPVLAESSRVADVLAHEMVHTIAGLKAKHGPAFKRCATAIGLEGQMTATTAGKELIEFIKTKIIAKIGAYPHTVLSPSRADRIKQTTRLVKCACPTCEYPVRVTRKWLEVAGAPICPACDEQMEVES